jgi:hypothetical protein
VNSQAFRLWLVAFDDGGTVRLGVIKCSSGSDAAGWSIFPLAAWGVASSTAEGGAGAADSAQVFYTGTAVTSKPYIVLGYSTWESGLGTVGTWGTAPSRIQLYGPGVRLPGDTFNLVREDTGAVATGTTAIPDDDSIPQSGEGDEYIDVAITPTSAANLIETEAHVCWTHSVSTVDQAGAIFIDAAADAQASVQFRVAAGGVMSTPMHIRCVVLAGTTSAKTFNTRLGGDTGSTTTVNGAAGARKHGGSMNTYQWAREIMT